MDDLMEKIQNVLSDKESLEQIQQLASMLGAPAEGKSGTEQSDTASAMPDLSSLAAIKDLATRSAGSDKNIALLLALRPLLKEENRVKIDRIIRIFRIMALYPLLRDSGLLGGDLFG